jgi:hypothetical protein
MSHRYTFLPLLFTLACRMACGDTLILNNGQKIEGRYLSSTDSAVQFEVNGKLFTYPITFGCFQTANWS